MGLLLLRESPGELHLFSKCKTPFTYRGGDDDAPAAAAERSFFTECERIARRLLLFFVQSLALMYASRSVGGDALAVYYVLCLLLIFYLCGAGPSNVFVVALRDIATAENRSGKIEYWLL